MKIFIIERDKPECWLEPEVFTDGDKALEVIKNEYESQKKALEITDSDIKSGSGSYDCYNTIDKNNYCGEIGICNMRTGCLWQWRITEHNFEREGMKMGISIYAPGIKVEVTDVSKVNCACKAAGSIMDNIFYENELSHDVITIHDSKGDCIAEVALRPDPFNGFIKGFEVVNKWYCLPEAKDVVSNIINGKVINRSKSRRQILIKAI